jgi:hypothetical protein
MTIPSLCFCDLDFKKLARGIAKHPEALDQPPQEVLRCANIALPIACHIAKYRMRRRASVDRPHDWSKCVWQLGQELLLHHSLLLLEEPNL